MARACARDRGGRRRDRGGPDALVGAAAHGLALGAVAIEVGDMLPYLAAIGIVTTSDVGWPANGAILAAYCVVMVAPALLLLLGRLVAARAVDPVLPLDRWLTKNATDMTGWVLGALGVLLALNAFGRLGWA
nr:GAP family protein [Cellulosimicrobium sp. MM]